MEDIKRLTDNELILNFIATRENVYFEEIYSRYKDNLFAYIVRMTSSIDDANDILQDVFASLYIYAHRFNDKYNLGVFIYGIARNILKNYYYKKKRDTNLMNKLSSDRISPDFTERLMLNDMEKKAYRIMLNLPAKEKEAFLLHYLEGMKYEDIKRVMGVSLRSVKSYVKRAREKIEKGLREYGVCED